VGTLATGGGLWLAAREDWPPAPAIAIAFVPLLSLTAALRRVTRSPRPLRALARLSAWATGLSLVAAAPLWLLVRSGPGPVLARATTEVADHSHGPPAPATSDPHPDWLRSLSEGSDGERAEAAERLGQLGDPSIWPALARALQDPSEAVRERAAEALDELGPPQAVPALETALVESADDEWVRLRVAEALAGCSSPRGVDELLRLAGDADATLVRAAALSSAAQRIDPSTPGGDEPDAARSALERLLAWWTRHGAHARWNATERRFVATPPVPN
jgi:hypothetical protein